METLLGKKAKVLIAAGWDFPDLQGKELVIVSIGEHNFCSFTVDGVLYPYSLGLNSEIKIID